MPQLSRTGALSFIKVCVAVASLFAATTGLTDTTSPSAPTVPSAVQAGRYIGLSNHPVESFLGIPYAQPPVGKLRWQTARPLSKTGRPFQATAYGPACLQPSSPVNLVAKMSEDCLTLNIWRPASAKAADKPLPVMVWIHGGGFVSGSGQIPGDVLAQEGVIVVSMNYRLGALGFFAHPQLDNPVANFGLSDVVKALRWVQRNIGTFNGDKDNVTIFGVSAGGMMVNLLLVNQQASGSFHKAISQSGYIAWPLPVKEKQNQFAVRDVYGNTMLHAEQQGREKASQWLEGEATLKQLKALPGEVITGRFEGFYSPIVDGVTLENQPYKLVKTHSNEVSLITGGNSFEGSVMPYSGYTVPQYLQSWKTFPGQVDLLYKEDWNHSHERAAKRAFGDERYLFSAYFLGQQWQHKPSPAWLYYIDQKPTKESPGSPHGYDQQLIFNTFKSQDAKTQRLAKTLRNYWVNFAKSGSPVLNTDKTWSANTQGHPTWLVLPSETEEVNLYATRFKSIKTRLENRESTEGNGQ